jgi:transmembrane sensor
VIGGLVFLKHPGAETPSAIARTYTTNAQQQATIDLGDGSRVTLAPRTTLRVHQFEPTARTVVLEGGEAYFEVTRAEGAPFLVHSGTATAQVLGTTFLVRHVAGNPRVHVAVTEGKVRVITPARPHESVTLTTGQVGEVTDSTTQVSTVDDLAPGTEWAPGRIMFRHTPLATVLQTMTQWYGYHFRYADSSLGARGVTMVVSMRSSAEALAALERVLAVNLTIAGDTITLVSRPQRPSRNTPRIRTYDVWTPTREVGR